MSRSIYVYIREKQFERGPSIALFIAANNTDLAVCEPFHKVAAAQILIGIEFHMVVAQIVLNCEHFLASTLSTDIATPASSAGGSARSTL